MEGFVFSPRSFREGGGEGGSDPYTYTHTMRKLSSEDGGMVSDSSRNGCTYVSLVWHVDP